MASKEEKNSKAETPHPIVLTVNHHPGHSTSVVSGGGAAAAATVTKTLHNSVSVSVRCT